DSFGDDISRLDQGDLLTVNICDTSQAEERNVAPKSDHGNRLKTTSYIIAERDRPGCKEKALFPLLFVSKCRLVSRTTRFGNSQSDAFLHFIHHAGLYLNRLVMYQLEQFVRKLSAQAHSPSESDTCFDNFLPAADLQNGYVVFLFVLSDLFGDFHTRCQLLHDLVVEVVDLFAKDGEGILEVLVWRRWCTHHEVFDNASQRRGCYLLLGVTPRGIRMDVAFDHKAGHGHVKSLLSDQRNQVTCPGDVAGVANDIQIWNTRF